MKSTIKISSGGKTILKTCRSKEEFENELRVYRLELDFVPKLIAVHDGLILELQYIDGVTLSPETRLDFEKMGQLFTDFHQATTNGEYALCHIDTNPRNYLITDKGTYYMIDFSESSYSYVEHDLVNFLLFWAACYEPNRFESSSHLFLNSYQNKGLCDPTRNELFNEWFNAFDERRRKHNKTLCLNEEWQKRNRNIIIDDFYRIIEG